MNCKCGHTTDEHLRHSEMCYRCRCPEFEDVRLSTLQAQLAEKDARITQLEKENGELERQVALEIKYRDEAIAERQDAWECADSLKGRINEIGNLITGEDKCYSSDAIVPIVRAKISELEKGAEGLEKIANMARHVALMELGRAEEYPDFSPSELLEQVDAALLEYQKIKQGR